MGLFGRADKPKPATGAVIRASAVPIDLASRNPKVRKSQKWQQSAWQYYDTVPEVSFAHDFICNTLRRVRIFPAIRLTPDSDPSPLGTPTDPAEEVDPALVSALAQLAIVEFDRLKDATGSYSQLMFSAAAMMSIPGEGYLVGRETDDGEEWGIYSGDEFRVRDGAYVLVDEDGQVAERLTENDYAVRVWRNHPRMSSMPNSPMKAVLEHCEEILILDRAARATSRSRLSAGALLMPDEISFGPTNAPDGTGDGNARKDTFLEDLMAALVTPIQEEGAASAVVPLIIRGKHDLLEKIKLLSFARAYGEAEMKQRETSLTRVANGLDLPNEVILGKSGLNHWTAWQVDDDTFKVHLQPLIELICDSLTQAFLLPALGPEARGSGIVVWYDASDLIGHPNLSADADAAFDRLAISERAYRRSKGYEESDAPDEDERTQRLEEAKVLKGSNQNQAGDQPADQAPAGGNAGGGDDNSGPGTGVRRAVPSLTAAGSTSAGRAALGDRLLSIDRRLWDKLLSASDAAVTRSLQMAGAKLRRKAGRNGELHAILRDVPQEQVAEKLGRAWCLERFTTDELLEGSLEPLRERYDQWTKAAQLQARKQIAKYGDGADLDEAQLEAEEDENRHAGWLALATGLTLLLTGKLFDGAAGATEMGEYDGTVSVPAGLIRAALTRAGGAKGEMTNAGLAFDPNGRVSGGVATGQQAQKTMTRVGLSVNAWVWNYGDPGTRQRPFEPHENLDSIEFSSWTDDQLAVGAGDEWLDNDGYYRPGDHLGCQCDFTPVVSAADDGTSAEEEEAA